MSFSFSAFLEICINATDKLNFGVLLSKARTSSLIAILKNSFVDEENVAVLKILGDKIESLQMTFSKEEIERTVQNTIKPYLCNELINTVGDYFDEGTVTAEDLRAEYVMQLCTQFNIMLSAAVTDESIEDGCVEIPLPRKKAIFVI